jgi:hypothetical protein
MAVDQTPFLATVATINPVMSLALLVGRDRLLPPRPPKRGARHRAWVIIVRLASGVGLVLECSALLALHSGVKNVDWIVGLALFQVILFSASLDEIVMHQTLDEDPSD